MSQKPEEASRYVRPPSNGVLAFAGRVYAEFAEDRIATVAGGIAFFALLALFPGIASVVSLYGLIGDRGAIGPALDHLGGFLPGGAIAVLSEDIKRLAAQKPLVLGTHFAIGFVIALWSASGGITALLDGLNIAFETRESRSFVKITLLALCLTVAAIVFMIVAIALTALLPQAVGELHLARPLSVAMQLSLWPLAYLLCALTMALTYRFGPARGVVRWKWILRASLIAAALWILGTFAFSWLVANYGSFNRTYGSLGSLVGFLTWLWLSLTLLLTGAEIACEFDRMDASHRQPDHRPQTAQRALVEQDVAAMAAGDVAGDREA